MGELARHLGVSVTYVSDVERGTRAPLTSDRIAHAAAFLGVDASELLQAAAAARGAFELDASRARPKALEVGSALARGWADLTDEELDAIASLLSKRKGKDR